MNSKKVGKGSAYENQIQVVGLCIFWGCCMVIFFPSGFGKKSFPYKARNHLNGIFVDQAGEGKIGRPGSGFGLGFGVVTDVPATGVMGSEGEYNWGGAAGTIFWIDPVENLIGIVMIQHMNVRIPLRQTFKVLTYGAIVD
jgi:CubicO group peptidase (beta-lactamase class C family)